MINIRSKRELDLLAHAGKIVYDTHQYLIPYIKPGITTNELDKLAEDYILSNNAYPSFKEVDNYPKSICTSINDEVVHGIPSNIKLKDGDIISIDIGAKYEGYHGDSAWTYPVGNVKEDALYLLEHTNKALFKGIEQVKPGNRIGDISHAIEAYAKDHNLGVVKELVGHGVGTSLHEDPEVPNYGIKGTGPVLKAGMVIAIEPMLNLGSEDIILCDDNWTIKTSDNSLSAHFEHTVAVVEDGYKILTRSDLNG